MPDEIIEELWEIKDNIAREYDYDVEALVAHLQTRKRTEGRRVVDLASMTKIGEQGASTDANNPRR